MAERYGKPIDDGDISLAINSEYGRTQNQLHIHISCLLPAVKQRLAQIGPDFIEQWQPLPGGLLGHDYLGRRVTPAELEQQGAFRLLASGLPRADGRMGSFGLAMTALPDGDFLLLATERSLLPFTTASAEEIGITTAGYSHRRRAPDYFLPFISRRICPHWFSSPPSLGETSASSAAAGVSTAPNATAAAPRAISGPAFTPASGCLKVPFTYSGERRVSTRIPLLSGSMDKSSRSVARLVLPVMLITAFSVSNTNSRGAATPLRMPTSAAAQLMPTTSSPNSCATK